MTLDSRNEILFPEAVLVAYANRLLASSGAGFVVHGAVRTQYDRVVLFSMDPSGRNYRFVAPVCEFALGLLSFRSILRGGSAWKPDGRPEQEDGEIAFYGNGGPRLAASKKALSAYLRSARPEPWQDRAAHREDIERTLAERLARGLYGEGYEIEILGRAREALAVEDIPAPVLSAA